ncbi:MMPL family transporter [Parahaliea mediterranea]|uniref:MMPL family transporter n=1 Tax=Parahaliea mediterranea TaxID=651086 RepID=UPI00130092FD|nr:MMPL family transporter [Parahaliea mediterranea]
MKIKPGAALWLAGLLLLALLAAWRWPQGPWLQTGFSSLLPATAAAPWRERAEAGRAGELDTTLVLRAAAKVEPRRPPEAFLDQAERELAAAGFAPRDRTAEEAERWRALSAALHPYRWRLLTPGDQQALNADSEATLAAYRRYLHTPLGMGALGSLDSDPAGTFRRFIEQAAPRQAGPGGQAGDDAALRILRLDADSLALNQLQQLFALYQQWQQRAEDEGLSFQASGAPLYGAYGAHSASREVSTIGLVSLLVLAALLYRYLRSARALAMTALCIASGLLCAVLATTIVTRQIHLITLVFGAALIGIAADYALHFLAHALRHGDGRAVLRGVTLGALSSALAFGTLVLLPFPGIRQIGVFMAAGLLGSYATVALLFPLCRFPRSADDGGGPKLQPGLRRGWALLALALLACAPGISLLVPKDDIRSFYANPPPLQRDADLLSQAAGQGNDIGIGNSSRYLLLRAGSPEALLQREEWLRRQLADAGITLAGISQLVPSQRTQQRNAARYRHLVQSGQLGRHLEQLGFTPAASKSLEQDLLAGIDRPLTLDQLQGLTLPALTGRFLGCLNGECASYLLPTGQVDSAHLQAQVRALNARYDAAQVAAQTQAQAQAQTQAQPPAPTLIDPVAAINRQLADYRHWVARLLLLGAALASALLWALLGWRFALKSLALPLGASLITLGLLGYLQVAFSIVNLLALLLIAGVSLDYALFRSLIPARQQGANNLAITLSALTSTLAFGMLGFSATPIISAFGITIALGLAAAYTLAWVLPLASDTGHRHGGAR